MASKPLDPPRLKVLTYSSFAGVYGPGPVLKKEFEKSCQCEVQWFLAEDSTALLKNFLMIKEIDMVLGWDQITKRQADKDLWEKISGFNNKIFLEPKVLPKNNSQASQKELPPHQKVLRLFKDDFFIPFDWSPIGFIYKNKTYKISNLKDLSNFKAKISFPEPRASNLGLQFYYWIYEHFKGDSKQIATFLKSLKNKVYGPVFSWSQSYGFFRKGQTQLSLSYLSSLLYHQKEEPQQKYFFADFPKESQAYHVEFFSISKKSKNKTLAFKFAQLLLSKSGQEILLDKNYMFPVLPDNSLPFKPIPALKYDRLEEFLTKKQQLLDLWEQNLY